MKTVFHPANSRSHADHGWLNARHSFSFGSHYDPNRMGFGALRVLNDDTIAPGKGFGTHPHDNMEIITIPLEGNLEHKDSIGNGSTISKGEIQVMSAGTGIRHSEYNPSPEHEAKLLQIWVRPARADVEPRYEQMNINEDGIKNRFVQIVSPSLEDDGVWVHQETWFNLGDFDQDTELTLPIKGDNHGVYFFLIAGSAELSKHQLEKRDALGVWGTDSVALKVKAGSRLLAMTVPMS